MHFNKNYGIAFVFIFLVELLIALYVRDNFIRPYIGDVLVVVLMYCFIKTFLKRQVSLLPLYLFAFAAAIEIAQLFHLVRILHLEDNRILSIILGTTFDIGDLLCYLTGTIILFVWQYVRKPNY